MNRRADDTSCDIEIQHKVGTSRIKPCWKQVSIASAAWNVNFLLGMAMGTNTVAIPQMKNESIEVSEEMRSWLGGVFGFGAFFWIWILTPMTHYLGVKKTYMFVCFSPFVGSAIIYFAKSSIHVFWGQAIQSLMQGSVTNVSIMVVTEYVSPENRSLVLTMKAASIYWGIWLANAIGTFFYWRYIAVTSMICSLYGITIFMWPESPFWLASKGRFEECAHTFRWCREPTEDTEKELKSLIQSYAKNELPNILTIFDTKSWWNNITSSNFYKPLFLALSLTASSLSSGKLPCAMYAIEVFQQMISDPRTAYTAMLTLDGINVLAMYLGCFVAKKVPRRTILFGSLFIGIILLYSLAIYGYLVRYDIIKNNPIISLLLLSTLLFVNSAGSSIISGPIQCELAPVTNRSLYCLIFTLTGVIIFGLFWKIFPYLFNLGIHVAFLIFGVLSTVSFIILYFYLPETKGKTYSEINSAFQSENIKIHSLCSEGLISKTDDTKQQRR